MGESAQQGGQGGGGPGRVGVAPHTGRRSRADCRGHDPRDRNGRTRDRGPGTWANAQAQMGRDGAGSVPTRTMWGDTQEDTGAGTGRASGRGGQRRRARGSGSGASCGGMGGGGGTSPRRHAASGTRQHTEKGELLADGRVTEWIHRGDGRQDQQRSSAQVVAAIPERGGE